MHFGICALILFGIFYFSEGKPCPEKTRPHKTRCEAFYKCTELPSQRRHVWVPQKCESGLIYEHNLGLCVLPDDEWECTLGDGMTDGDQIETNIAYKGAVDKNDKSTETQAAATNKGNAINVSQALQAKESENAIEVVVNGNIINGQENRKEQAVEHDETRIEASGDGEDEGAMVELDGLLQAENREDATYAGKPKVEEQEEEEEEGEETEEETSESPLETVTKKSKIDPKLTAHLQRLSQLIDGLQQQYQQGDKEQLDLRPDQLNAFLAHFNIQNKYNLIKPTFETSLKQSLPTNTEQPPEPALPHTAAPSKETESRLSFKNKTHVKEAQSENSLAPETKGVLTNALPKQYTPATTAYTNPPQIVVNQPDGGSVLFAAVPHYATNSNNAPTLEYVHNTPHISEDTLNTVLELSKQMIATQNIPKVIPNPGYYAQANLVQPLFLPASAFQSQPNPFAAYFNGNNNNNNQNAPTDDYNGGYGSPTGYKEQHRPRPTAGFSQHGGNTNTIIHNNIIPVHVSATNSGEKEVVDSYGQSLGHYPPLNTDGNAPTTHRPAIEFGLHPTSPTLSEYFSPSPHLDDNNVNNLFQLTDRYPTVQYENLPRPVSHGRPSSHFNTQNQSVNKFGGLFRPNGHKIESMEIETDELNDGNNNIARPLTQLFSYNEDQYQSPAYGGGIIGNQQPIYQRPRPTTTTMGSNRPAYTNTNTNKNTKNKFKPYKSPSSPSSAEGTQLVNVGGNFVSFDVFQNSILPLFGQTQSLNDLHNIEVITCTTGVRQPNITDCTRYYVCSKKDGRVLSYSCPPYTAFNAQTRICDAQTYTFCSPDTGAIMGSRYTQQQQQQQVNNQRLQLEAIQMLQDAKRRQEAAIKAQNIANLIQKYGAQNHAAVSTATDGDIQQQQQQEESAEQDIYIFSTTTVKPATAPVKKRKYYCKEGDKLADQTSTNSYFVCYKNAQGMMKGHKFTCTKGLIFCAKTSLCTLSSRCT